MKNVLLFVVLSTFGSLARSTDDVQLKWQFPTEPSAATEGTPCGPVSSDGHYGASCGTTCSGGSLGADDCAFPLVCCADTRRFERLIEDLPLFNTLRPEPGCGIRPLRLQFPKDRLSSRALDSSQQLAVVGGREATPFSWPWAAALYLKSPPTLPNINGRFQCGAVLIGRRHILTAAHCFASRLRQIVPDDYYVLLGSHERSVGFRASLDNIWVHPKYIPRLNYNDIAILRLSEEVPRRPTVAPVCLPAPFRNDSEEYSLVGRSATLIGWGDTSFGGPRSKSLQEVQIPIVSNEECDEAYKKVSVARSFPMGITQDQLCAGHRDGGKDACQGDSGGPLLTAEGSTWVLRGLVSFGFGCGDPGFPGVYTRVDAFIPWIAQQIAVDRVGL